MKLEGAVTALSKPPPFALGATTVVRAKPALGLRLAPVAGDPDPVVAGPGMEPGHPGSARSYEDRNLWNRDDGPGDHKHRLVKVTMLELAVVAEPVVRMAVSGLSPGGPVGGRRMAPESI